MGLKKRISALLICGAIILGNVTPVFADVANVVTLGANLTDEQKQIVLDYFGVKENEVVVLEVNNQEERKYLEGIAPEAQIGTRTYSCAYVQPTKKGSAINVKTVNLTYVTSSMIASTLTTCGITDANVIAMTPLSGGVSGTGALTGIMKAFEDATGEPLDEEKKEIASEELVITGDLGEDIGQDKATGVINDIKTEIIKNNTQDTIQIADTINNVTNNYNITLTPEQQQQLESLMAKVAAQDYDYKEMKDALNSVKDVVNQKLDEMGEKVSTGVIDSIKEWFTGIGDWFTGLFNNNDKDLGILETTNDNLLGDNVVVDATDKDAIKLPTTEETKGFFQKIWDWFTGLFDNNTDTNESENNENSTEQVDAPIIGGPEDNDSNTTGDTVTTPEENTGEETSPQEDTTEENDTNSTTDNTDNSNVDTSQDENNTENTNN
ncbi:MULTISPECIES: DUF1002 domain-containing protein [unclassified Clostridium]|uniref:DUF1002 domain-containing protein n=1 Tax=Clostridium TaxID=1485 RepID=UPI001C8CD7F7|nr:MULTISPECIES: DUF1002 domain-containing protein [unclassified Clostridium]MBX9137654.1 DUF1002 domain-containing protein [Clostridium sp. K12(2020)]MBX9144464.1 DUF1002 domain-containing protein [Clostridium sp. K13]MDU2289649.1 DUF1002 domain-containing protein [Clostridium celatum]MDU4325499.1 DUF1002 domain-containing protein [Clostridium celatum]